MNELLKSLENKIKAAYEEGTTLDQAEKLAAEFLHAQMVIAKELHNKDLDARMRKSGLKAVRSRIYLDAASKGDKKPTEATLAATVDTNDVVQAEQSSLDAAEVSRDELERYYDIFMNAHVFFRGVSRGKYE